MSCHAWLSLLEDGHIADCNNNPPMMGRMRWWSQRPKRQQVVDETTPNSKRKLTTYTVRQGKGGVMVRHRKDRITHDGKVSNIIHKINHTDHNS
jgi:hypothetical protein